MNVRMEAFVLPESLSASMPPERRGVRRDHVRMLVLDSRTGERSHAQFYQLSRYLRKGDLLVLNASRTIPAILYGEWRRDGAVMGRQVEIRLARRIGADTWDVLAVEPDVRVGDTFAFTPALSASVTESSQGPFARLAFSLRGASLMEQIYEFGEPIRYEYITHPWELDYYQTVYASMPGSVEMPSAGRAFSWELLFKLQRHGIRIAYVQLHTGLSYLPELFGHPSPTDNYEQFDVPDETAEAVKQAKEAGGRIVAVGTTVVRALESAALANGKLGALSGWTNLMIDSSVPLRVVDGLITGFHEPEASHLDLLSAFIDPALLHSAYQEAIGQGYLWHEFGDMNLII